MSAIKIEPQQLKEMLSQALATDNVIIRDDSHKHAGHAGTKQGGHYHATIVSEKFQGLNTLARHRLVYESVNHLMNKGIHALSLTTSTADEK